MSKTGNARYGYCCLCGRPLPDPLISNHRCSRSNWDDMPLDKATQDVWDSKIKEASEKAKQVDMEAEAERVEGYIDGQKRQDQAFQWVCRWGIKETVVARKMGITQQAVSKLLKSYFHRHPEQEPKYANRDLWTVDVEGDRDQPQPKQCNSEESADVLAVKPKPGIDRDREAASIIFLTGGSGYHFPGKTALPEEKKGTKLRKKHKKDHS